MPCSSISLDSNSTVNSAQKAYRKRCKQPIYTRLENNQIRLVRIHDSQHWHRKSNAKGIDIIKYELKTFHISDKPEYIALSYCWTKKRPSCRIQLNDKMVWVRPNVYAYLDELRKDCRESMACFGQAGDSARWVFIDALCINQDDIAERGHQVSLMTQIYSNAIEVVAWMGTELDYAIAGSFSGAGSGSLDAFEQHSSNQRQLEDELERLSAPLSSGAASTRWMIFEGHADVLRTMYLQHEFWSRMWIVQEIALARRVTFKFRNFDLQSAEFETLVDHLSAGTQTDTGAIHPSYPNALRHKTLSAGEQLLSRTLAVVSRVMALRDTDEDAYSSSSGFNRPRESLFSAIIDYSEQECAEPYDRIFGVLGLTSSTIKPDYQMPKPELFQRILTEGILHFDKTASSLRRDKREFLTAQSLFDKKMLFTDKLLSALDLDSLDLIIALIIHFTMSSLGFLGFLDNDPGQSIKIFLLDAARIRSPNEGLPQARIAAILKDIKSHLHSSDPMPHSGSDTEPMSFREWLKGVTEIFADVVVRGGFHWGGNAKEKREIMRGYTLELEYELFHKLI